MYDLKKFLGGMDVDTFMNEYWMKKPLLVKGAIDNANDIITPEQLIELATDEDFESRIIFEKGHEKPWYAEHGPFSNEYFNEHKDKGWTLVGQCMHNYSTDFANIQQMVKFIPAWQFDDVMVTYSKEGCSVGAHIDRYNVFIIQAHGKKRWLLEEGATPEYQEDLKIRLLKEFNPNIDWVLEPGDMVYIPPTVGHHGIALEEGMSYSVGFKAFDYEDMFASYFQSFLSGYTSTDFYKIPDQNKVTSPYEIDDVALDAMMHAFKEELFNKKNIQKWFANYVTEPRFAPDGDEEVTRDEFLAELKAQRPMYRDEHTLFSFYPIGQNYNAFINGFDFIVNKEELRLLEKYLSGRAMDAIDYKASEMSVHLIDILYELYQKGAIFLSE
jgi:50S ribosomal protein L16 3-hydroxylase